MFQIFCRANNIVHVLTPPYHPMSNGLAERSVGIVKVNLRKYLKDKEKENVNLKDQIYNFLFSVHNLPNKDGLSPSQKLFSYSPNTVLSSLQKPLETSSSSLMTASNSRNNNSQIKNNNSRIVNFKVGETVLIKFGPEAKWVKGTVKEMVTVFVYLVNIGKSVVRVHRDSIIKYQEPVTGIIPTQNVPFQITESQEIPSTSTSSDAITPNTVVVQNRRARRNLVDPNRSEYNLRPRPAN